MSVRRPRSLDFMGCWSFAHCLRTKQSSSSPTSRNHPPPTARAVNILFHVLPHRACHLGPQGWDTIMADVADVRSVLFLYCPEDVLEKRLLSRGKSSGRTDDNAETAKRRFQTYVETTLPVS